MSDVTDSSDSDENDYLIACLEKDLIACLEDELDENLEDELDESSSNSSSDNEAESQNKLEGFRCSPSPISYYMVIVPSVKVGVCIHPGSFGGMCIYCGKTLDGESGLAFGFVHKGLRLHDEEVSRLCNNMTNLLCRKKLYLVLDLDHTLLNSTSLHRLSEEERPMITQKSYLEDVSKGSLFKVEHLQMVTKLRPFVRTFLKEASEIFDLCIYTLGDRNYSLEMAKLLDPEREYFNANSNVISRDDGTQNRKKHLGMVLENESAILILDDTKHVWPKHKDNLILMRRYLFFNSSCEHFGYKCKSLAELRIDESEADGALAKMLEVLKHIHYTFFKENHVDRDVRQVLSSLRSEILRGCVIVLSRALCRDFHTLKKIAKKLGATCLNTLEPNVTHVVSNSVGTRESKWALEEKKFLVNSQWIEDANFFWQKQPEENFSVEENN
ncbi:RNA polymerase II C-terminal domain phosphatase-like 4 [Vicia villosa]|uniref:RNA polymerase II C-terminal domain phosphatase-like 4 n=1 Tax=Vicia villosa TaxID=3911 RepID=UPI00273ACF59|nr:RNA polymerase II C-terminal domain phosphatase-like 4 [Vicia villosa]